MEVGGGVNLSPKQDNSLDEGRKTEVTQMVGVRTGPALSDQVNVGIAKVRYEGVFYLSLCWGSKIKNANWNQKVFSP